MKMQNPYIPYPVEVIKIVTEVDTKDIKTFRLAFVNKEDEEKFKYTPGQFAELCVYGKGESPIGIASSPTQKGYVEFTVQKAGVVTTALHEMEEGTRMGIRGPLGNSWPIEYLEGKNVVVVGGGFAFTTLRSLINYMIYEDNRKRFGKITVVYGARNPGLLIYKDELKAWAERGDIEMNVTVDKGDATWTGREGFVPTVCKEVAPSPENAVTVICGPPIMIRFTLPVFFDLGFSKENIITSLEMRMKCGIGKCGRCNVGSKYVCKDGPVFTFAELDKLTRDF
ncbi:MAG TPA: FAD/NAD(P)-binding protein [Syntrophales bacterium]|nr:FAD/NAD(P)-binding protein [Syntrophales bacterium]HOM07224.1 FAD/NAD(P)-binding protein [Syntrophales bacterium]HON99705.1 FAD/NAD(P)-binding protein [Syntrophales bacterium]HPC01232.1 FAD/NAD(P)-binding protein [Syntrophales bacterium]HPQ06887.1 FAD/NAD(P)-binding protein [Syntrophales bacterium]